MTTLLQEVTAANTGFDNKWPDNACMFQPFEDGQISLPDFASCLCVRAFLKMCDLPHDIELCANAEYMSPSGKVPFLRIGSIIVSELEPIVAHVHAKGYTLSDRLSDKERAQMKAYMTLVESILARAQLYISWCHTEVATAITKPRYGSVYSWPLNQILPYYKQREVKDHLSGDGWADKSLLQVQDEVEKCCETLSQKLGDQTYFFGDSPTELDAVVYGHLFAILTTTLPERALASTIEKYQNLKNFCTRIDELYFKT